MAIATGVVAVTAGAGVEGGDEHEVGREGGCRKGTRDGDDTVFKGLAEDLEGLAVELGEFVEEEDPLILFLVIATR